MVTIADPAFSLFGRTRQAILGLLLLRPEEQFHLRQIVRLTGIGIGSVQRELAGLVSAGIVTRQQSGRQVYFQANRASPIFPELQGLMLKTSGLVEVLRAVLHSLEPRIRVALVFGSMARAAMHQDSDVDLLLISDDLSIRDLAAPIRRAADRLGREVNINLYRPDEWARRRSQGHPLVRSILANPRRMVIGGEDELEGLAEKRLAPAAHSGSDPGRAALRRGRPRSARRK